MNSIIFNDSSENFSGLFLNQSFTLFFAVSFFIVSKRKGGCSSLNYAFKFMIYSLWKFCSQRFSFLNFLLYFKFRLCIYVCRVRTKCFLLFSNSKKLRL